MSDAPGRPVILIPPEALPSAMAGPGERRHRLAGQTMGTVWTAQVWHPGEGQPLVAAIEAALDEAIRLFSLWQPDSALSRFNRAAPGWHDMPLPALDLLAEALLLAGASEGALDPTLGELADLWGFGPTPRDRPPTADEIAAAHGRAGWTRLRLDREGGRAFQPGGLALDLGGIAKGWAADRVSEGLRAAGAPVHMIEIGGEIVTRGLKPDGRPWWIEVEPHPDGDGRRHRVALTDGAMASSGDYRRQRVWAGQRVPHALDPATGRPVRGDVRAATVFAATAARADALASAMMAMPAGRARAFAARHRIPALIWVEDDHRLAAEPTPELAGWTGSGG